MKYKELIDKPTSDWKGEFYPISYTLLDQMGIYSMNLDIDKVNERLRKVWYRSWTCTDTTVGISGYYLDGELICIIEQPYRKSNEMFKFVSQAAYLKLHKFFIECLNPSGIDCHTIDWDAELPNHYLEVKFRY